MGSILAMVHRHRLATSVRAACLGLWVLACSGAQPESKEPTQQAPPPAEGSAGKPQTEQGEPPAPAPRLAQLGAELCRGRTPCEAIDVQAAGTDPAGRTRRVVRLKLFEGAGVGEDVEARLGGACDPYEYWLFVGAPPAAGDQHLLAVICNDGYGASGVGEDVVTVGDNVFTHRRYGGSAWRWEETRTLSLTPLRVTAIESGGYLNTDAHFSLTRWSFAALSGRRAWYTPLCKPPGTVDPSLAEPATGGGLDPPPPYAHAFELVPAVRLPAEYVERPSETALGRCATIIDSAGRRGFLLDGTPGDPRDASLAIVTDPEVERLYLEVKDDAFVTPSGGVHDQIELWTAPIPLPESGDHCLEAPQASVAHWVFSVSAQQQIPHRRTANHPNVAVVDVEAHEKRIVIDLRHPVRALTVVYADTDDGRRHERRLATSVLEPGALYSLGEVRAVSSEEGFCEVVDGRLEPVVVGPLVLPEG